MWGISWRWRCWRGRLSLLPASPLRSSIRQASIPTRRRPPWDRPGELISIFSLLLVKYLLKLCEPGVLWFRNRLPASTLTRVWGEPSRTGENKSTAAPGYTTAVASGEAAGAGGRALRSPEARLLQRQEQMTTGNVLPLWMCF